MKIGLVLLLVGALGFGRSAFSAQLSLVWKIDNKFNMPESAAYDPVREVIYVSNVNQYVKDNNGFISRVSADGKRLELNWLVGLHSPTGLAVRGNTLYAVDYDALVVVDLLSEKIIARIPAVDADNRPVLNDVAVASNGDVYVSGSGSRTIYQLKDDKLQVWLKDDDRLKSANGLLVFHQYLLHGGDQWTVYNLATGKQEQHFTELGEGLKGIDGVIGDGNGGIIVSLLDDPRLWYLASNQKAQPLTEDKVNGIDMDYIVSQQMLIIPMVGNSLAAYKVTF